MVGSMGPDTLWNVRNGTRDRFGTYVEWETRRGRAWTGLIGVRGEAVRSLRNPPVLALTATAPPKVKDDILAQLQIPEASVIDIGLDRPNLRFIFTPHSATSGTSLK